MNEKEKQGEAYKMVLVEEVINGGRDDHRIKEVVLEGQAPGAQRLFVIEHMNKGGFISQSELSTECVIGVLVKLRKYGQFVAALSINDAAQGHTGGVIVIVEPLPNNK